jgi:hypothetical protein
MSRLNRTSCPIPMAMERYIREHERALLKLVLSKGHYLKLLQSLKCLLLFLYIMPFTSVPQEL